MSVNLLPTRRGRTRITASLYRSRTLSGKRKRSARVQWFYSSTVRAFGSSHINNWQMSSGWAQAGNEMHVREHATHDDVSNSPDILRKYGRDLEYLVLMTNKMHNSCNQFLFHSFLSALHVSNESSRSSSGARHNILYYTVWYNRYNRAIWWV